MKLISFVSAGAFILFSGFILKKPAYRTGRENTRQLSSLYDTKWKLKKIHNAGNAEAVTNKAFIKFNQSTKSAGGNGGCNTFGSTIIVSGNTVSIKDIFSTKMYCEGVQQMEDDFFKQLQQVNRFVITGKALTLYKDKEVLLEFEKE